MFLSILPQNFKKNMQRTDESDDPSQTDQQTLRHKILPLLILHTPQHPLNLSKFQLSLLIFNLLQIMKFPIDHHSQTWIGTSQTAVLSYLDLMYYMIGMSAQSQISLVTASIVIMNIYVFVQVGVFLLGLDFTQWMMAARKVSFLIALHILLIPLCRILIGFHSNQTSLYPNFTLITISHQLGFILSFIPFATLLALQTYLNFQFLPHQKQYSLIKKSSHTQLAFFIHFILLELTVTLASGLIMTIMLNLISLAILGFALWKDQQIEERAKLIQIAGLVLPIVSYLVLYGMLVSNNQLEFYGFVLALIMVVAGILQLKPFSLRFELDNINKWPTCDIMIKQASTLIYYLSRGTQYLFKVWVHGYMEIHRQKCDNISCPSRCKLSDYDRKILDSMGNQSKNQQLIRINNIIKVIFTAGYKLNPIPCEIKLQNSLYLYQRGQQQLALRKLLMVDESQMLLDKYYIHQYLKELISMKIKAEGKKQFLDLVTEIRLQKDEEQLLKKLERCALLNLQFWSILNQDNPDFQKLNEVAASRTTISRQLHDEFTQICSYSHSQKLTTIYASYLEHLQNDERVVMNIYKDLQNYMKLDQKVLVHDWSNSSTNILLISLQQATLGKILEMNTQCAKIFGYEKHNLIGQSISNLYHDGLYTHQRSVTLTNPATNQQVFTFTHKNGYLVIVKKYAMSFGSMAHGQAVQIILELQLTPTSCYLLTDQKKKIVGTTATLMSVLELDLKAYEGEAYTYQFFKADPSEQINFPLNQTFNQKDLLKSDFLLKSLQHFKFSVEVTDYQECKLIQIKRVIIPNAGSLQDQAQQICCMFQFKFHADPGNFKYIGANCFAARNMLENFDQSQPQQHKKQRTIDYAQGISTVRLKDSIIQLKQQIQQEQQQFARIDSSSEQMLQSIPRKDEEQIFQSKKTYQQFLDKVKLGGTIPFVMVSIIVLVLVYYVIVYMVLSNQMTNSSGYASQIVNQNMIIGSVAQLARYINQFQVQIRGNTTNGPATLVQEFNQHLAFLQSIELKGSAPAQLTFTVQGQTYTHLSSQYISTMISYATSLSSQLGTPTTVSQLQTTLNMTDRYTIDYLLSGNQTKKTMMAQLAQRQTAIVSSIQSHFTYQILFLILGLMLLFLSVIFLVIYFHSLNKERVKIFQIFLQISQNDLAQFSSKTQRFLISLHSQQESIELMEDDTERKLHSSSFAKRKSFKLITFNSFLYVRLIIIPILMTAFLFHAFWLSNSDTKFQAGSMEYFGLTSKADYILATTSDKIDQAVLYNTFIDLAQESYVIRYYYRDYLIKHETSFGIISDYQTAFDSVTNRDICRGTSTSYGFMQLPRSCLLPELAINGTYLIATNLYRTINKESHAAVVIIDLTFNVLPSTHIGFVVLSDAQKMLSRVLLQAQDKLIKYNQNQLLLAMLIWMAVVVLGGLVIWGYEVREFIRELNQIKGILGIIPLTLVRKIPQALRYVNELVEQKKSWLGK